MKTSLIVSKTTSGNITTIIIKRKNPNKENRITKLGDVFKFIQSGFVLKGETGLGATTLELHACRNSIIVEPIRVTASSKAQQYTQLSTKHKKLKALYVGSVTNYHPTKINDKEIIDYVNDN